MLIVDAHEDIAWNVLTFGRDILRPVAETRASEQGAASNPIGPALLGWPEWILGRVAVIFATLFAAPMRWQEGSWDRLCYTDAEQARLLYLESLQVYQRLEEQNPDKFRIIRRRSDLETVLSTWGGDDAAEPLVGWVLLMEGADCVREPQELLEWYESGVRIVGPAWEGTRYAGGTREPGPLTPIGFELLDAMSELGMVLDLSHMTEEGVRQALELYDGVLIASHSNPYALVPHSDKPYRHLSDGLLCGIAERDGVMGTVVANHFLKDGWVEAHGRDAVSIADVAACIDYVCQTIGDAKHVGIGSDFDGGFGLNKVPSGLDSVADLQFIGDGLQQRGFTPEDIEDVLGGNWLRVLCQSLPES